MAWSNGALTLYNVKDGGVRVLADVAGPLYSVSFSPDGERIAAGGGDGLVHLWEVKSGREIF